MTALPDEIFESAIRMAGDFSGVFEYDGETGYFYLCEMTRAQGQKVIDALHIVSGAIDCRAEDVTVRWNASEHCVGLFIASKLWGLFDLQSRRKHGGNYKKEGIPTIPKDVSFSIENS